jgi:hypothetical protein
MCGCPIGVAPWNPDEFDVSASIKRVGGNAAGRGRRRSVDYE